LATLKDTSSTAVKAPKRLLRRSISIKADKRQKPLRWRDARRV
jgi:hypothetical protein